MGGWFSKLFSTKEINITMVGLDNAGKTTILYQLRLGETVTTIPTIGVNVESIKINNINFSVIDLGGQSKIRPLWRHYYEGTQGIVFVVDSSDKERIEESGDVLRKMCKNELLKDCALLILGNKKDIEGAVNEDELTKLLKLEMVQLKYLVKSVSATNNEGLTEAFIWLSENVCH
ncbi:hypothetical protein ENUP19_0216G0025 [Entamoeba nuttalli]|uniref:ADP-ribosylation factor 1, putative n=2 Tax=Entamoeba nuttalli TaxID=412467 RepID=K2GG96_ENTNP|nr:ADP-ribosylation factor 1, putative [Entamoeba nuttalli P19]EKE41741.1 ADP-ribosylation factor 1, putative [Entamoeba nuttalli P19]|eukprot:XP_008855923.1 ADP-ribosylation factor 1, putative [Entamoeba nuttalli P19]